MCATIAPLDHTSLQGESEEGGERWEARSEVSCLNIKGSRSDSVPSIFLQIFFDAFLPIFYQNTLTCSSSKSAKWILIGQNDTVFNPQHPLMTPPWQLYSSSFDYKAPKVYVQCTLSRPPSNFRYLSGRKLLWNSNINSNRESKKITSHRLEDSQDIFFCLFLTK